MSKNCLDTLKIAGGIYADSHIHLHTSTPEPVYIKSCLNMAKNVGIKRTGFLAHGPRLSPKHTSILNNADDLHYFRTAINGVKDDMVDEIYVGIELDYSIPGVFREHTISMIKESKELDFVIGSIHHYDFLNYKDYVHAVLDLMETYPICIFGHLDVSENVANWKKYLDCIFRCAADKNIAVELNGHINRCLPEKIIDAMCCNSVKYGVSLTYGSDAHRLEDIGRSKNYINHFVTGTRL